MDDHERLGALADQGRREHAGTTPVKVTKYPQSCLVVEIADPHLFANFCAVSF